MIIGKIIRRVLGFFVKEIYINPFREVVTHEYETGKSIVVKENTTFDVSVVLEKKNILRLMIADIICDIMLILFIIYLLK